MFLKTKREYLFVTCNSCKITNTSIDMLVRQPTQSLEIPCSRCQSSFHHRFSNQYLTHFNNKNNYEKQINKFLKNNSNTNTHIDKESTQTKNKNRCNGIEKERIFTTEKQIPQK